MIPPRADSCEDNSFDLNDSRYGLHFASLPEWLQPLPKLGLLGPDSVSEVFPNALDLP